MTCKISGSLFVIVLFGVCLFAAQGSLYAGSCSNATLNGTYAVTVAGWATPPPKTATEGKSSIPEAVVGLSTFDGAGNWTSSFTLSHNGDISSATAVPGVYSINSDCTGSLTGVGDFAIVVLNGGSEITGVQTDKDTTGILDARVQNATGCSTASLSGMYSITLAGFGTPPPHLSPGNPSVPVALGGLATLNGNGNLTGSFTSSHNGEIGTLVSDSGSYTVNSDCTGSLSDATEGLNFAIVLLNGGAEALGIQTDNGTAVIVDIKKQ